MIKFIYVLLALVAATMMTVSYPEGATAIIVCGLISTPILFAIRNHSSQREFLNGVFALALLTRLTLGLIIHVFELREVFGPDSTGYHFIAQRLVEIIYGMPVPNDLITQKAQDMSDVGYGMGYIIGGLYLLSGEGILIAQTFCGTIGAATVPLVFFCSYRLFNNLRVAKLASLLVALFPCFIIWSSQLLKDGIIVFLLVLTMTLVIKLQEKFNLFAVVGLIFAMIGVMSLRFYIFYMVAVAVVGTFVIGTSTSVKSIIQRLSVIVILGLGLTYFGIIKESSKNIDRFVSLDTIQASRSSLAKDSNSGFGEDIDVSTTEGALAAIPVGLFYLMFAPFPWDAKSFVQILVLPEIFLWWALIPFLFYGLSYTMKNQLRRAIPILLFTLMLTLSYSLFQGNAGMIYRQRTQIQIFFFIFIAVGLVIKQEQRENKRMLRRKLIHGSPHSLDIEQKISV